jgi:hypothetical protein
MRVSTKKAKNAGSRISENITLSCDPLRLGLSVHLTLLNVPARISLSNRTAIPRIPSARTLCLQSGRSATTHAAWRFQDDRVRQRRNRKRIAPHPGFGWGRCICSHRGPRPWCECIRIAWRGMSSARRFATAERPWMRDGCDCPRRPGALILHHPTKRSFEVDTTTVPGKLRVHESGVEQGTRKQREQRTLRQVGLGGQNLSDLGIRKIRLISNSRPHVPALQGFGIEIVD